MVIRRKGALNNSGICQKKVFPPGDRITAMMGESANAQW